MGAWRLRRDSDQQGGLLPAHGATRLTEGKVMAYNIVASVRSEALKPFQLKTPGLLASIGRRTGVARILGINFSGFIAWWLWRTIYLLKLPRLPKAPWILSKHRMDTLQFLIISDTSRSCKDL